MSDAMSCAEFGEQYPELLPGRTVLSLFSTDPLLGGGEPGKPGANGEGMNGGWHFLGMLGWGGSDPTPNITDPGNPA